MEFIETDAALATVCRALSGATTVYLDTEFESARAGKELSLIQLGTDDGVWIVDALRLPRLEPLGRALARPNVTWVLHAGLQDLELLIPKFGGARAGHLFDTQIAWALTSAEASVSLSYLKFKLLGLRTMKTHQTDDWMRRPLPAEQLRYAAADIEHLPEIHRKLLELLSGRGRERIVEDATAELLLPEPREDVGDLSLDSFRNAWQLDVPAQAALRALIDWYNSLAASERRFAPQPKTLLAIASRLPVTRAELARVKGVHPRWVERHGDGVVRNLKRAVATADGAGFVPIEPAAYADFDDIRLDGWLAHMRAEVSAAACVAPELVFNGKTMRGIRAAIVGGGSRLAGASALTGWRRELLLNRYEEFVGDARDARGDASREG